MRFTSGWVILASIWLLCACRSDSDARAAQDRITYNIRHGDLKSAAAVVDQALHKYGASPEWSWRFRILKAHVLVSQSHDKEALAILGDSLPPEFTSSDLAVRKLMLEGMAYRVGQDFAKSGSKLAAAEELAARTQPQLLCEVLNFRGALQVDEQDYVDADATYNRALNLARQYARSDQEASAEVSLAWVAMKLEHFDEAIDRGQLALARSRSLAMQGLVATTLGNLGWSYFQLGDFDAALDFYKQAAQVSRQSGLPGYELYWFTGIANSYAALHEYNSAAELAQQTLQAARTIGNPETTTECLNDLAEIYLRLGRVDLAQQYNQQALEMERRGLDHFGVLESTLVSARIASASQDFERAEELLRKLLQDPVTETPLRWEAQARLADLHDKLGLTSKAEVEYRTSLDTLETARASINGTDLRLSYVAGGIEFYGDFIGFLISRQRIKDALQVAELSRARTLAEGVGKSKNISFPLHDFQPQRIAARLSATLLFYWVAEKHSYLWVISPSKITCLSLPPADQIDALVKTYNQAVLSGRDVLESGNAEGKKLYSLLVEPAKKWIPANSRVILLPDGSLYGLNFETLIAPEPKPHFWIEDVTLSTASSLTLLSAGAGKPLRAEADAGRTRDASRTKAAIVPVSARAETSSIAGNLLLVGNAVSSSTDFPPLRQAAAEIDHVGRYFPASRRDVLAGAQATSSAFLQRNPERFEFLHFVTHGIANRAHPLDSAVILSPDPAVGGSYKLYAREIVKHPLGAYLVTISACNGSGTRAYSGEGLVGLSWAFQRAGAHNVIAALWEVNDASTPQLMDAMYAELTRGRSPSEALRAAKLTLLRSDSVFRKPFYWAPFQLYSGS